MGCVIKMSCHEMKCPPPPPQSSYFCFSGWKSSRCQGGYNFQLIRSSAPRHIPFFSRAPTVRRRRPFGSATPLKISFDVKLSSLMSNNSPSKGPETLILTALLSKMAFKPC